MAFQAEGAPIFKDKLLIGIATKNVVGDELVCVSYFPAREFIKNWTHLDNYTVKTFSEIFPKIVGQLKIQMGRKFFQRYSREYFRHRTGNSPYCLVGEISR